MCTWLSRQLMIMRIAMSALSAPTVPGLERLRGFQRPPRGSEGIPTGLRAHPPPEPPPLRRRRKPRTNITSPSNSYSPFSNAIMEEHGNPPLPTLEISPIFASSPPLLNPRHPSIVTHPPLSDMPIRVANADEGNYLDSLIFCPIVILENLLASSLRPYAHKPDFIRPLGPKFVGHSNARRRYSSINNIRTWEHRSMYQAHSLSPFCSYTFFVQNNAVQD
jgi:hypothetical protein